MIDFCIKKKIYVLNKIRLGLSATHCMAAKGIKSRGVIFSWLFVLYCCLKRFVISFHSQVDVPVSGYGIIFSLIKK